MIKWTVALPRTVAEDDAQSTTVDAHSIEDAIIKAAKVFGMGARSLAGETFIVSARVKVTLPKSLPLESV